MHRSKHTVLNVVLVFAAMGGLTGFVGSNPVNAATLQSLTLPSATTAGATCAGSVIRFMASYTGTNQDTSGTDYIGFLTYEGNGTPISYVHIATGIGAGSVIASAYDGTLSLGNDYHLADLNYRPVTLKIYDISALPSGSIADQIAAAEASPLLGQASFDPRTDSNLSSVCAYLPFPTVSVPALSLVGLAALIGLLALGAVAVLRRRV